MSSQCCAAGVKAALLMKWPFIPYLIARVVLGFLNLFRSFGNSLPRKDFPVLCLESGIKGWELIEYKELLASAKEYVGNESVRKIAIDRSQAYVAQVRRAISENQPTHYVYDSRTGSESAWTGLWQSFQLAVLFQMNDVVPICVLTDLPVRAWRTQTAVVSARRGVVVSLMSPRDVTNLYPHRRIIGPTVMPFSRATMKMLKTLDAEFQDRFLHKSLIFTGSLYEPRTTLLECVRAGLGKRGIVLEMKGRELGSRKFSDEDYWGRLASAAMVITTADQIHAAHTDWTGLPHLIYRYLEVPLAGSVLVAQEVPALGRYLQADVHYLSYRTADEAIEKITHYWSRPDELRRIAQAGAERARAIVEAGLYWVAIDTALGQDAML